MFYLHPLSDMSIPAANLSVVIEYRDSIGKAVTKNVIVVVLSMSINYVNIGLIQTFHRHQVGPSELEHPNHKR